MITRAKTYSFDVFDTCVTRLYAYPTDLFYDLSEHILKKEKGNFSSKEIELLAKTRIIAEKEARFASKKEDITINEIYFHFNILNRLFISSKMMLREEIALEEKSIKPILSIKQIIQEYRQNGHIIFISDMYLPTNFIKYILIKNDIAKPNDPVYVSSEIGLTKHSGNLFKFVLKKENLQPQELLHTGDNLHADFNIPNKLGIKANLYKEVNLNHHERYSLKIKKPYTTISSKIASISRVTRLSAIPNHNNDKQIINLASIVIAPLLTSFVAWVLKETKKQDINRLYFVARDGQILYKIGKILSRRFDTPTLKYIYGSRRAWLLPSITELDQTWRRLVVTPGQQNRVVDILSRLGMDSHQRDEILNMHSIDPRQAIKTIKPRQAIEFLDEVFKNPKSRIMVERNIQSARSITIRYLEQEKLLEDDSWAIIDTGWSLNCQAALKRILEISTGNHSEPKGFYIGLARDHLPINLAGIAQTMITKPGSIFSRRRVLFEHCFTPATHPSICGYRLEGNRVYPIFTPETRGQAEIHYTNLLQEAILKYVELAIEDDKIWERFDQFCEIAIDIASRFISNPTSEEAHALMDHQVIADLRHEKTFNQVLCNPLTIRDVGQILYTAFSHQRAFQSPVSFWLEGSSVLSPTYIRLMVRAMLTIDKWLNALKK